MALEHFILLLLLVPCIAVNIDQIDSVIEEQRNMNEVFQDSITYLMKQRSIMQTQLENLSSHCSMNCTMSTTLNDKRLQSINTKIETLKDALKKLSQRESAEQMKQSNDIGLLFTKMNHIKDIKNGMAQLMKYITDSTTRSEQHLTDLKEELNKRMDEVTNHTMVEMNNANTAISKNLKLVWKMIGSITKKP